MDALERSKALQQFKDEISTKTADELREIEQELIKKADEADKANAEKEFTLPVENYKEVAKAIRMILDKNSVEWRFTQALVAMYDFWNPEKSPKKVLFPMLDSTLRTIGEGKFTGYAEWAAVVAVNKYFEPIRDEYVECSEVLWDIAAKHNELLNRLKLLEPQEDIPAEVQVQ